MGKIDIRQSDVPNNKPQKHPCLRWFRGSCPFAPYFPDQRCPLANVPINACEYHVRHGYCMRGKTCWDDHDATVVEDGDYVDLHEYFLDQWSDKTHPCHFNYPGEPCRRTPCHFTDLPATTCVRYAVGSGCTDAVCPRGFLHVDADGHDLRKRFLAQKRPPHLCTAFGMPCDFADDGACVYRHVCVSGIDMSRMPDSGTDDIRKQYVKYLAANDHPCHVWFGSCKYGDNRCFLRDFAGDSCYNELFNPDGCPNADCPFEHVHPPTACTLRAVYQERAGYTTENKTTVTRVTKLSFSEPPRSEQSFRTEKRPLPPPYDDIEKRNKEVVDPYFEDPMSPKELHAYGNVDQMLEELKTIEVKNKQAQKDIDALNDAAHEDDDDETKRERWLKIKKLIHVRQTTWARKGQLDKAIRLRLLPQRWAEMREEFKRRTNVYTSLPVDLHFFCTSYLCDIVKRLLLYSATLADKNVPYQNLYMYTGTGEMRGIETANLFKRLLDILENDKWMTTFIRKKTIRRGECKVDVTLNLKKLRSAYEIPSQPWGHKAELVSLKSVKRKPNFDAVCNNK